MSIFAVISGNSVTNLIVAESKEEMESVLGYELIEHTDENPIGIGWTLVNGEWIAPPPPEELEIDIPMEYQT